MNPIARKLGVPDLRGVYLVLFCLVVRGRAGVYSGSVEHAETQSWRPFAEVVTERKAELGLSFRDLERRTKDIDDRRGLSAAHLVRLFHGDEDPTPRAITLIARALDMDAGDFLEYHLHEMRTRLDERLDFHTAAENFELAKAMEYTPAAPRLVSPAPVVRGRRRYAAAS